MGSTSLCFIDFATKCALGEEVNLFDAYDCQNWFEKEYCEVKALQRKNNIELLNVRRAKPVDRTLLTNTYRKKLGLEKLRKQYIDMVNNCNWSDDAKEDI